MLDLILGVKHYQHVSAEDEENNVVDDDQMQ